MHRHRRRTGPHAPARHSLLAGLLLVALAEDHAASMARVERRLARLPEREGAS